MAINATDTNMKKIVLVSSWLIGLLFLSAYFSLNRLQTLINIKTNGLDVIATVTSTECKNHGRINYTFNAGNKLANGHSKFCAVPCGDVNVGNSIPVRYYADDSNSSECGSILEKVEESKNSAYASLALILTIAALSGLAIILKINQSAAKSGA